MKQVLFCLKLILCTFLLQAVSLPSLMAQETLGLGDDDDEGGNNASDPSDPIRQNWHGLALMSFEGNDDACIVPQPVGGNYNGFYVAAIIFADDVPQTEEPTSFNPPLDFYYNLPNGTSGFFGELTSADFAELTPEAAAGLGVPAPDVGFYTFQVFEVCIPECTEFVYCSEYSLQMVTSGENGYIPYPIGVNPQFPAEKFAADPTGNSYYYTEYKEICCPGITNPTPGQNIDPCFGLNGVIEAGYAPNPYPYGFMDCEYGIFTSGLAANPNTVQTNSDFSKVELKVAKNDEVNIFPNPSSTDVTIKYTTENSGTVTYEWIDVNGKLINSSSHDYPKGTQKKSIDISAWQPGIYFLKISSEQGRQSIKFVKS